MKKVPNSLNTYATKDGRFFKNGRELKQQLDINGYKTVSIQYENRQWKNCLAHRQIALTFIDNVYSKPCVHHKDHNKQNNCIDNLEWVTYSENTQYAYDAEAINVNKGEDVHNSKLKNEDVHAICKLLEKGLRNIEIAKEFNIPNTLIKSIRAGRTWTHISEKYTIPKDSHILCDSTVMWICEKLQEGVGVMEITRTATNPRVKSYIVSKIKRRVCYNDISKHYKF